MRVPLVLLAALLLAGCTTTVAGTAVPGAHPTSTAASGPNSRCRPADLMSCMVPLPAGAVLDDGFGVGKEGPVTLQDYVTKAFSGEDAATITSRYQKLGLVGIAHRGWHTDTSGCDIVLLNFARPSGATGEALDYKGMLDSSSDETRITLDSVPSSLAAYVTRPNSDKIVFFDALDSYGTVAMEVFGTGLDPFDKAELTRWVRAQIDIIR